MEDQKDRKGERRAGGERRATPRPSAELEPFRRVRRRVGAELLSKIELIVSDVDGVWTDGRLTIGDDGRELKTFHVRDGAAVVRAREAGITVALLSGRVSRAVERRARELRISHVVQGSRDKGIDFLQICADTGIEADRAAMLGDDLPDLSAFYHASVSAAPSDAADEVLETADVVLSAKGGMGAVREFVDKVLAARAQVERRGGPARRRR